MVDCNLYITKSGAPWKPFRDAAMQCISGVWQDVKTSNGLLLSLLGGLADCDPKPFYADMSYNPVEVTAEADVVEGLISEHQSKPYGNRHTELVNLALLFLILGKRIVESNYKAWAEARAKAIFRMYNVNFSADDLEQIINLQWATNVDLIYRRSRGFRVMVLDFLLKAHADPCLANLQPVFHYICTKFLPYARLKAIWLVQSYLIYDWRKPILGDPYLSADVEHLATAVRAWAQFPRNERVYAGLIATDDVFHLLSGHQLERLKYIAARVGALSKPCLQYYKCKAPPDKEQCDALVEKYFSPNAKLPEDMIQQRLGTYFKECFMNHEPNVFGPKYRVWMLDTIAECENQLTGEQHEVRQHLAKQKVVVNLIIEFDRVTPQPLFSCRPPDLPSAIAYPVQAGETEECSSSLPVNGKKCEGGNETESEPPSSAVIVNETEAASVAVDVQEHEAS